MNIKLSKNQEKQLIELGLKQVIDQLISPIVTVNKSKPKSKTHHKWTKAQHEKFSRTMREKWAQRTKK